MPAPKRVTSPKEKRRATPLTKSPVQSQDARVTRGAKVREQGVDSSETTTKPMSSRLDQRRGA